MGAVTQADSAVPLSVGTPSARERSASRFTFDDGEVLEGGESHYTRMMSIHVFVYCSPGTRSIEGADVDHD